LLPAIPLIFAMITRSSWAAAATPDASEPRNASGPGEAPSNFIVQAAGIVAPGWGASVAADARVTYGLHLGIQAGFFSDDRYAYPFVGLRASYRVPVSRWLRVVPTFGVARIRLLTMDEDPFHIDYQSPVSPTVGVQVAAQFGAFVTGLDAQLMPVHATKMNSRAFGSETSNETLVPIPIALFAGATF
jgi:hypothetical protein